MSCPPRPHTPGPSVDRSQTLNHPWPWGSRVPHRVGIRQVINCWNHSNEVWPFPGFPGREGGSGAGDTALLMAVTAQLTRECSTGPENRLYSVCWASRDTRQTIAQDALSQTLNILPAHIGTPALRGADTWGDRGSAAYAWAGVSRETLWICICSFLSCLYCRWNFHIRLFSFWILYVISLSLYPWINTKLF